MWAELSLISIFVTFSSKTRRKCQIFTIEFSVPAVSTQNFLPCYVSLAPIISILTVNLPIEISRLLRQLKNSSTFNDFVLLLRVDGTPNSCHNQKTLNSFLPVFKISVGKYKWFIYLLGRKLILVTLMPCSNSVLELGQKTFFVGLTLF